MTNEELEKTKKLIQQTNILSSVEKAEWLQLIATMDDRQVSELVKILSPHPAVVPVPSAPAAIPPVPKVAPTPAVQLHVDITQKELPAAHSAPAAASHDIPPKPVSNSTELQSRVESIVKELQQKKAGIPLREPLSNPFPHPAPTSPPAPASPKTQPGGSHKELPDLKTPADFEKLQPADLHGQEPAARLQQVLTKMAEVAKSNRIFDIVQAFERSSLYHAYIEMGTTLLSDPNPNRDGAYDNLVADMKSKGEQWLTKEELEAFVDFRNRLEQMV